MQELNDVQKIVDAMELDKRFQEMEANMMITMHKQVEDQVNELIKEKVSA